MDDNPQYLTESLNQWKTLIQYKKLFSKLLILKSEWNRTQNHMEFSTKVSLLLDEF